MKKGYSKNNYCKCGKLITDNAKTCNLCFGLSRKKLKKKYYCLNCKKEICYSTWKSGLKRCKSCSRKGILSWTYKNGKPKCIDCDRELIQYDHKRCWSCYVKWSQISKNNPMYGKYHSDKSKQKIGKANKGLSSFWKGKKRPEISGNKNPNWSGGTENLPYPFEFNDILKSKIRKRNNYTCQNCNMIEEEHLIVYGTNSTIHHIDYNKINCKETNLITLCTQCNGRANYNRDYWQDKYQNRLLNIKGVI